MKLFANSETSCCKQLPARIVDNLRSVLDLANIYKSKIPHQISKPVTHARNTETNASCTSWHYANYAANAFSSFKVILTFVANKLVLNSWLKSSTLSIHYYYGFFIKQKHQAGKSPY